VALDGTKVKANAALNANRTAGTIAEQISRMLTETEMADAQEGRQFGTEAGGPPMPKDLGCHVDRQARLKACQEKLEARATAVAARQKERIAAREVEEQETGKRKRGRKQKEPAPSMDLGPVANPTEPARSSNGTGPGWCGCCARWPRPTPGTQRPPRGRASPRPRTEGLGDDELLACFGLTGFQAPVFLRGPVTVRFGNTPEDGLLPGMAPPFVAVQREWLDGLSWNGEGPFSILTVENLTSFHRQVREARPTDVCVVYTGGFPSLTVIRALRHLLRAARRHPACSIGATSTPAARASPDIWRAA